MGTTKSTLKAKRPKRVDRRKTTSTRITPELRAKIDAAAEQSERSLAQEIEFRLEQSFAVDEAFGGRQLHALFGLFGNAAVLIEQQTGKAVFEHWDTWVAVRAAWESLGVRFGPQPSKKYLKMLSESVAGIAQISKPPPEDAPLAVREAHLAELDKKLQSMKNYYRHEEEERVQKAIGEKMAAALLPEQPKKGG